MKGSRNSVPLQLLALRHTDWFIVLHRQPLLSRQSPQPAASEPQWPCVSSFYLAISSALGFTTFSSQLPCGFIFFGSLSMIYGLRRTGDWVCYSYGHYRPCISPRSSVLQNACQCPHTYVLYIHDGIGFVSFGQVAEIYSK